MKTAVFSDIHGNYYAFMACLDKVLSMNVDSFIFLGDYLGEFAYPKKTMELIYDIRSKYPCKFIRGNKEDYWLNLDKGTDCDWKNGNNSIYSMIYNYSNLTRQDLEFFSKMPICDDLEDDYFPPVTVCHGSMRNNREKLFTLTDELMELIGSCENDYILCGHSHIQQAAIFEGKTLINPGAVGVALHSENGRAQFMIMEWDSAVLQYEFYSIDYDRDSAIRELHESELYEKTPYWCRITEHLIRTGEVSHGAVLGEAIRLCREDSNPAAWYSIPDKYWESALANML